LIFSAQSALLSVISDLEEAEMKDLQRAIYLAVTDPDFRARLVDDPKAAIKSKGLRLGADELEALSELRNLIAIPLEELTASLIPFIPPFW